jgi:cbb3-type cytochrome oxidase subunit 3
MLSSFNIKFLGSTAAAWKILYCTMLLLSTTCVAFRPSRRLPTRLDYATRILLREPSSVVSTRRFAVSVQEKTNVAQDVENRAIWEQLGIEDGKLALGVKPDEVLNYIGT